MPIILNLLCFGFMFCADIASAEPLRFEHYLRQAEAQGFTYLPQYIKNQERVCQATSDNTCWSDLEKHIHEIFICPTSPQRFAETAIHDEWLLEHAIRHGPYVIPEPHLQTLFNRLVQSLSRTDMRPLPLHFELVVYKGEMKGAHSLVHGKVVLSEALWLAEPALTELEVAAVMAHELSHAIAYDSMTMGCLSLEWIGSDRTVRQAQKDFIEDFRGSTREQVWSNISQTMEYSADVGATKILFDAGLDPYLIVQALKKLASKNAGGISSGSHPDFDVRIQAAEVAAARWTKR